MEFDKWQQEVIDHKGHVTIRKGRQVGGSTATGKRISNQMMKYAGTVSLIIAPALRQSSQLFMKTMTWLHMAHQEAIQAAGGYQNNTEVSERRNDELLKQFEKDNGIFNEMPTKSTVVLKLNFKKKQGQNNIGSICYSMPAGKTGVYLRAFALDFLHIDEAAYVPDQVYMSLRPMILVSQKEKGLGWKTFISTPCGKGGFFYDSHFDDDFKHFHINTEKCGRMPKAELAKEKKSMSKIDYAQEYLGEFTEAYNQFFPTALIKERMTFYEWDFTKQYDKGKKYFLGVDVARYGADENAFVVGEMQNNKSMKVISAETSDRKSLTDTFNRIILLDDKYNFNRIFIDDSGIGAGVTDFLIEKLGRKVVGLSNAKKTVDADSQRTTKIFKEDLYSHAAMMLETPGKLELINSLKLLRSLKSMTFKYTTEKNLKIFGTYSHLAEAFVRVCWAEKAKSLKLFCY